jgi:lipopolysaccharide transport system permease protein
LAGNLAAEGIVSANNAMAIPSAVVPAKAVEYTTSAHPTLLEAIRDLWAYRELFFFLAWRDITIRYRQTLLGAAWAVLQPLITMLVFTFLFGVVVKVDTGGIPAPIFYFSALLPWLYFAATATNAGNSLVGNGDLIKKVYFPRLILPGAGSLVGLADMAISALILVAMMAYYGVLSWRLVLWLPLTLLLFAFSFGIGILLSALNVKYRDVKHAIPFMIQIWLFLTPVIYPVKAVPQQFRWLLALNPLSGIIEAFRATVAPTAPFHLSSLMLSIGATILILVVGTTYFRRVEGYFTDIV